MSKSVNQSRREPEDLPASRQGSFKGLEKMVGSGERMAKEQRLIFRSVNFTPGIPMLPLKNTLSSSTRDTRAMGVLKTWVIISAILLNDSSTEVSRISYRRNAPNRVSSF